MATERAFSFRFLGNSLAAAALALGGATGCFAADSGRSPPGDRVYFPVGIALGPSRTDNQVCDPNAANSACPKGPGRMYVANSDFDLQYNAGTLQVYDLEKIRNTVPKYDLTAGRVVCANARDANHNPLHDQGPADALVYPGPCQPVDSGQFLLESVQIGAFATDVVYKDNPKQALETAPHPPHVGRLFVPVRGDRTLHWVDVDDAKTGIAALDCGQGSDGACDSIHRRGNDTSDNTRGLQLPPEPFGIAVDDKGEAVVMTHQSDGDVTLFVNEWSEPAPSDAEFPRTVGPNLEFVQTGLATGALAIASIPVPKLVSKECLQYQPGFLMTYRNSADVTLVRYFSDKLDCTNPDTGGNVTPDAGVASFGADPTRPFLEASRSTILTTNSQGYNSRGVAIDAKKRQDCEAKCADTDPNVVGCLRSCAALSLDVYISDRAPPTLIRGQTLPNQSATGTDDLASFYSALPVTAGPSRVVVGDVIDRDGKPARRIFVVCFDSRLIYVYDPTTQGFDGFETTIYTGRGPHAFIVDAENGLGYVGHFTDSYIGVVDLDRRNQQTYGKMLLTVGSPVAPRASK